MSAPPIHPPIDDPADAQAPDAEDTAIVDFVPAPANLSPTRRLTANHGPTALSFLLALTLHAALIALGLAYHTSARRFQEPTLALSQGWATEYDDPTPSHPSVTFLGDPIPPDHPAHDPTAEPTPPRLSSLPPVEAPPVAASAAPPDLALGTADLTPLPGPATGVPPSPARRAAAPIADGSRPADTAAAAAVQSSTSDSASVAASSSASSSAGPQGTPDAPPVPSSRNKIPPYPKEALRRRLAGTVVLELHIAPTGQVTDALIQQSSGHDLLDRAARDTALTWTFTPARLDGRPVPITVLRPVNFIPPR